MEVRESNRGDLEAIDSVFRAVEGRPGSIRTIRKKETSIPRNKSRLGAIAEHTYYDNAFYISWTLTSGAVLRMVAMDSGRYLAIAERSEAPRFICMLGLDKVPRPQWRGAVQGILQDMSESDFVPASTFPWGDELFIGPQAEVVGISPKFHLGASSWGLTANVDGVDAFTEVALCAGSEVLTRLHPEAVERGWRIGDVQLRTGRYGAYQEIQLLRRPPVETE